MSPNQVSALGSLRTSGAKKTASLSRSFVKSELVILRGFVTGHSYTQLLNERSFHGRHNISDNLIAIEDFKTKMRPATGPGS